MRSLGGSVPSAHGQWPRHEGAGNARPARPGCTGGKTGRRGTCGPREACLKYAGPWDTGRLCLRSWAAEFGETGPSISTREQRCTHVQSMKAKIYHGEAPVALEYVTCSTIGRAIVKSFEHSFAQGDAVHSLSHLQHTDRDSSGSGTADWRVMVLSDPRKENSSTP